MWRPAWLLLLLAGCGRIAFAPVSAQVDADADADELGPWQAPTLVTLSIPTGLDDPTLTADMLEMYVNHASDEILVTTRASIDDAWSPMTTVPELNSTAADAAPRITGDGLTIFFASGRMPAPSGGLDIWVATRAARGQPWAVPVPVGELSAVGGDHPGGLTADELAMALDSRRNGGPDDDIFLATRASKQSPWGTPVEITEINATGFNDESPVLSADGLSVYFDSIRSGNTELYVARRASREEPFGPPALIVELNSTSGDFDPWVSPDERHMVFVSARGTGLSLWEARR